MYFGCFFFNAHGYKYITLNADLSEYIIIFTSHLFICVRMCVIFRHTDEASSLVVSARRLHRAATVVSARRLHRVATVVKGLIYVRNHYLERTLGNETYKCNKMVTLVI